VADELWLVADGKAQLLDGDLEDYKNWIEARRSSEIVEPRLPSQKVQSKTSAKPNKKILLSKQSKLETALTVAQKELDEASRQLADPAIYANRSRDEINQLSTVHATLENKVAELEASWLELEMALEE
jgi:ATP-binding cassette subfamily F protein 3